MLSMFHFWILYNDKTSKSLIRVSHTDQEFGPGPGLVAVRAGRGPVSGLSQVCEHCAYVALTLVTRVTDLWHVSTVDSKGRRGRPPPHRTVAARRHSEVIGMQEGLIPLSYGCLFAEA